MKLQDIDRKRFETIHSRHGDEETLTVKDNQTGEERPATDNEWFMYGALLEWKQLARVLREAGDQQAKAADQAARAIGCMMGIAGDESHYALVRKDGAPIGVAEMRTIANWFAALDEAANALLNARNDSRQPRAIASGMERGII